MTAQQIETAENANRAEIELVLHELAAIRKRMVADAAAQSAALESVHANFRDSAENLAHYLSLRRHDLRPLQLRLAALGLSSLGRAESHVLATVDAVLEVLRRLASCARPRSTEQVPILDFAHGQSLLADHTDALLGAAPRTAASGSWSRCRAKRRWSTRSSTISFSAAWTACVSIARTTMRRRGCG